MTRTLTSLASLLAFAVAGAAAAAGPPGAPINWPLRASLVRPGDTEIAGVALLAFQSGPKVCYRINLSDPTMLPATSAHLHRVVSGQAGPALVTFLAPRTGHSSGCATAPQSVVDGLRATPRAYAVVVRTAGGSLRGQVRPMVRVQPGPGR